MFLPVCDLVRRHGWGYSTRRRKRCCFCNSTRTIHLGARYTEAKESVNDALCNAIVAATAAGIEGRFDEFASQLMQAKYAEQNFSEHIRAADGTNSWNDVVTKVLGHFQKTVASLDAAQTSSATTSSCRRPVVFTSVLHLSLSRSRRKYKSAGEPPGRATKGHSAWSFSTATWRNCSGNHI